MVLISYGALPLFSAALLGQKAVGLSTNDFQNKPFYCKATAAKVNHRLTNKWHF